MKGFKVLRKLLISLFVVAFVFQISVPTITATSNSPSITLENNNTIGFHNYSSSTKFLIYTELRTNNSVPIAQVNINNNTDHTYTNSLSDGVYYIYKKIHLYGNIYFYDFTKVVVISPVLNNFNLVGGPLKVSASNLVSGATFKLYTTTSTGHALSQTATVPSNGSLEFDVAPGYYTGKQISSMSQTIEQLLYMYPFMVIYRTGALSSIAINVAVARPLAPVAVSGYGKLFITSTPNDQVKYRIAGASEWNPILDPTQPVMIEPNEVELIQTVSLLPVVPMTFFWHPPTPVTTIVVDDYVVNDQVMNGLIDSDITTLEVFGLAPPILTLTGTNDLHVSSAIDGAVIKLYKDGEYVTEANYQEGAASFLGVRHGEYYVTQTVVEPISEEVLTSDPSNSVTVIYKPDPVIAQGGVLKLYITEALPNALIHVYNSESEEIMEPTYADEQGNLVIDPIDAGFYGVTQEVTLEGEEGTFISDLSYGSVRDIEDIELGPLSVVGGVENLVVSDAYPGATIRIYQGFELKYQGLADENGVFEVSPALPGVYFATQEYSEHVYLEVMPTLMDQPPTEEPPTEEPPTEEPPTEEPLTEEPPTENPAEEHIFNYYSVPSEEVLVYPAPPVANSRTRGIGVSGAYPFAALVLYDINEEVVANGTSDENGNFRFRNVPVGTYKVTQVVQVIVYRSEGLPARVNMGTYVMDGQVYDLESDFSNLANSFYPSVEPTEEPVVEEIITEPTTPLGLEELIPEDTTPLGLVQILPAYIKGYPNRTFNLGANITRSEVAAAFVRIMNLPDSVASTSLFKDVPVNSWNAYYINEAYNLGLINGYPNGQFKPNLGITRAELAVVFVNYLRIKGIQLPTITASLNDTTGHWASLAMNQANMITMLKGEGGLFKPNDKVTREQFVLMVNKLIGRPDLVSETPTFGDVDFKSSYYGVIESAASEMTK